MFLRHYIFCLFALVGARVSAFSKSYSFEYGNVKLVSSNDEPVTSVSELRTGVYSLSLGSRRGTCNRPAAEEFLGYNNRTCTSSLALRRTAGPVMRGPSSSMTWREWMIRVVDVGGSGGEKAVTIQPFLRAPLADDAKCLGFVSSFYNNPKYKETCIIPPYGGGLFLNGTGDDSPNSSQVWTVRGAKGVSGEFELVAANKPGVCARLLAVEDCRSQPTLVESPVVHLTDSVKVTSWRLRRRFDEVLSAPSSPPLPPSAPPGPVPGPKISTPNQWPIGYVTVLFQSLGGNADCSVRSIGIKATAIDFQYVTAPEEQTIEFDVTGRDDLRSTGISMPLPGWRYEIVAIGKCREGGTTQTSNKLLVYGGMAAAADSGPPPPDSVLFSVRYAGLDSSTFNAADQSLACANILTVQPGGTCKILTILPGSAIVTGTVTYSSPADASNLVQTLAAGTASTTLQQGVWNSGTPTGVTTLVADADPVPAQPRQPNPPSAMTLTTFDGNCPSTPAMDVTFTPPADLTGILAYTATCYPGTPGQGVTATVVATGAGTTTIRVAPLSPVVSYKCDVQSLTVDEYSTKITSSSAQSTGCAVASGAPTLDAVALTTGSETSSISIAWTPGADSAPPAVGPNTFFATCVTAGIPCPTSPAFDTARPATGNQGLSILSGLTAGTTYDCYVVAKSAVGSNVCSAVQPITTSPQVASGAPTLTVSLKSGSTSSSVDIVWTPGADSIPSAGDPSFYPTCVTAGTSCPTSPAFYTARPAAGSQVTTTLSGLAAGTAYDCYVVAKSAVGSNVCSAVQQITTTGTAVPAAPSGPCTSDTASATDWVLGCGATDCAAICQGQGKPCIVAGMQSVDSQAKGVHVLGLFGVPVTIYQTSTYADNPAVDYQSPTVSKLFWNGASSTCAAQGLLAISRRICCCGTNCPVS